MVKPKTQVKASVKAKNEGLPVEIMDRQENTLRMAITREAGDMKKSSKAQTKNAVKVPARAMLETREDNAVADVGSAANDPMGAEEIAKAVLTAKESGSLGARIVKTRTAKEGKPGPAKDAGDKVASGPQDMEARRMRLKNLIVQGKERGYLTYAE